jgi:hypothetical protein
MSNREDFKKKTRNAVAARAGWHCSFEGCGRSTVGPSDESPERATMIGKAAHIAGAAPGPGSRRYDPSMTPEQRTSIKNAIWLCGVHADLIDRDEVTYTVEVLHRMKRAHEVSQAEAVRTGSNSDIGAGLLAIGPDVICTGDLAQVSAENWRLRLKHFLAGDLHQLVDYIDSFVQTPLRNRYVLSNELGDGRVLAAPPILEKCPEGYTLSCSVAPGCARIDAQNLGSSSAVHPQTNDLYLDESNNIARVSGLAALPQYVRSSLSMQRGENVFAPTAGMRFFEYFEQYAGSLWLDRLMTLDVIRQAAIPAKNRPGDLERTPLQCVTRVHSFELLSLTPENNRLPVRVNFEVQGVGRWQHEFSIYMPTKEQMAERARVLAERPELGFIADT